MIFSRRIDAYVSHRNISLFLIDLERYLKKLHKLFTSAVIGGIIFIRPTVHGQSLRPVLFIHSANPASITAFMDRGSRLVGIYFFFVSRPQLIMSFFSLIIVGSCIYYLEIFVAFLLHEKSKSLKRKTRHSSRAKYH